MLGLLRLFKGVGMALDFGGISGFYLLCHEAHSSPITCLPRSRGRPCNLSGRTMESFIDFLSSPLEAYVSPSLLSALDT